MTDREILEALISRVKKGDYAKKYADRLIESYGSFYEVLGTRPQRLIAHDGLDERSAVLISLIYALNERLYLEKNEKVRFLSKTEDIKRYVNNCLVFKHTECFLVICLNNRNRILNCEIISEGTASQTLIDERKLVERLLTYRSNKAIIAHNHPRGSAKPSMQDLYVTKSIEDFLNSVDIELVDHMVVGEDEVISIKHETDYSNL